MRRLFVWVRGAEGAVRLAGELAITDPAPGGRFEAEFEYSREWSSDPEAFSLDPASLPLQPPGRRYRSEQLYPPLAVFDDALPDDWGRGLLARALKSEGRKPSPAEMLVRMQGAGTGALQFTPSPSAPTIGTTLQSTALAALLAAAGEFESGNLSNESAAFRQLLEGSSRAGGARPKALVHDEHAEWVAKFPSSTCDGIHDVVGLEATCLELGRRAGLIVPESRLQLVGRQRVLLVRRFDISHQGGRVHMVSMRTLCKERPGIMAMSYTELASVLGRYSASPAVDLAMLFRHMAFNAAIGNVDDHLKNFWVLATGGGYRLAPAFDLVPDISGRGEHTLSFQYGFGCPTSEQLLAVASAWGVKDSEGIVAQVTNAVAQFGVVAHELNVRTEKGLEIIETDVRKRLKLIGSA